MMVWLRHGGRKIESSHPIPQTRDRVHIGNGRGIVKPQACPQWHTSFIKIWSPISSQTSSPTGGQVLKHMILWGSFSFKLLQLHTGFVANLG